MKKVLIIALVACMAITSVFANATPEQVAESESKKHATVGYVDEKNEELNRKIAEEVAVRINDNQVLLKNLDDAAKLESMVAFYNQASDAIGSNAKAIAEEKSNRAKQDSNIQANINSLSKAFKASEDEIYAQIEAFLLEYTDNIDSAVELYNDVVTELNAKYSELKNNDENVQKDADTISADYKKADEKLQKADEKLQKADEKLQKADEKLQKAVDSISTDYKNADDKLQKRIDDVVAGNDSRVTGVIVFLVIIAVILVAGYVCAFLHVKKLQVVINDLKKNQK